VPAGVAVRMVGVSCQAGLGMTHTRQELSWTST
jgi:hypothetical protein